MLGFLTFGTTLTFLDLALKNRVERDESGEYPRELPGSKGYIWLYKNHNPGFPFGFLKEYPKLVELVPICITSGLAGVWIYLMEKRGSFAEKLAVTLALAGGVSNVFDRLKRGYVVDYFSIRFKELKKVVFNLGDIFIFAGTALLTVKKLIDAVKDK